MIWPAGFDEVGADHVQGLLQLDPDELHDCCTASVPGAAVFHDKGRASSWLSGLLARTSLG